MPVVSPERLVELQRNAADIRNVGRLIRSLSEPELTVVIDMYSSTCCTVFRRPLRLYLTI
jgi:hypothetical protein